MIAATKFPILLKSNKVFNDMLLPLRERKTSLDDSNSYVFFCRYIGLTTENEYYDKILNFHRELSKLTNIYLVLKNKIDIPLSSEVTDKINSCISSIGVDKLASGEIIDVLEQNNIFSAFLDSTLKVNVREAFREVICLFVANEKLSNVSIGINFIIKLMCWVNRYVPSLFDFSMTVYNPKVMYYGDIKKHEGYFLILLSLIGCDVIFINTNSDEIFNAIDKMNRYSYVIEEPKRMVVKEIELLASKVNMSITSERKTSPKVILRGSTDIFNDLLLPINQRLDFIENTIYPVFFQRYIGVEDNSNNGLDIYYNAIFNIDKKLCGLKNGYVRFDRPIPMISGEETANILKELQDPNFFNLSQKDIFINKLLNLKVFPKSKDEIMNLQIKKAFREIIYLYIERDQSINTSKLQNFVVKLIGWINSYINLLFKELIQDANPKILYYGEIKQHDIYFLIYFFKLGCDVIYINSEENYEKLFQDIDPSDQYSTVIKLKERCKLQEFPLMERQVRKSTVAYNASKEIEQVIYGDGETGLFKARQYDEGQTYSVGLKTTYDELKILWNEPANIRPEFRVEGNTVYVPNLFAKINGVFENINDYWSDYKYFTVAHNTFIVKGLPFTKIMYSKQDLFASAFLFNDKGLVDENKLFKSSLYKMGYLKNSLQHFIVHKINELILSKVFKENYDEKFKLKILMTIINMEGEILKLLEKFDFTAEVPKLVIYDNTKENFSEEDIILIAFMNKVGADIVIFAPTNYNNVETLIRDSLFDVHQLKTVAFELQIPEVTNISEKSTKSSIFKFFDFKGGSKR
ncbi:MAG: hypothetical protein H7Y18_01970 [Clostridiaceae bacterium]|nr:hypothetical protein [Clostridiaceae bacterium]